MLRPGIRVLGAAAPLCFPTAPSAVQCPSRDNVLSPGDRAGHQRSLHLFIFLNISYFERMINNKESEIGMGTFSALVVFFREEGCLVGWEERGLPWQGKTQTGCSKLHRNGSAQAAPKGPQRGVPSPH